MPPFARKVVSRNASTASESQDTLYGKLQEYQVTPTPAMAERLQEEFPTTVREHGRVPGIG